MALKKLVSKILLAQNIFIDCSNAKLYWKG